jgi:DNA-binding Lrp family transcriptional regulator
MQPGVNQLRKGRVTLSRPGESGTSGLSYVRLTGGEFPVRAGALSGATGLQRLRKQRLQARSLSRPGQCPPARRSAMIRGCDIHRRPDAPGAPGRTRFLSPRPPAMSLDKIDERIVAALIEDARASYATIGSLVGLSAPAVKRRVDRLQETGAIRGFTARVDPAALGWTTEAYVELFCRALTSPADIRAAVRRYPEVVGACTVTGEADALLHIQAADVGHFEQVVERIRAEPFTTRTRSVIVMSRLIDRTGGPVPASSAGEASR